MSRNLFLGRHSYYSIIVGMCGILIAEPRLFKYIIPIVILCIILRFLFKKTVQNYIYKQSINMVDKKLVLRENVLHNDQVTIIYTPDEKIVVMDNLADKRRAKRMFTLNKKEVNVNKAWHNACKVFDSFMTLDSLETFYSLDTNINVITLDMPDADYKKKPEVKITKSNQGPKFVDMQNVRPDSFGNDTNITNQNGEQFVDMNNIQTQKQYLPNDDDTQHFSDMGDILAAGPNKIDVNFATAGEIAILPGINIVKAKKIVEYRDLNGLFKNEEDFFTVANVKAHFVQKIKPMIIIGKPSPKSDNDNGDSNERVVDF